MSHRFHQVDVFGEATCTGNPVVVVLDADGLDDETLRRFSVWSKLLLQRRATDPQYSRRTWS